jgi:hypothetical protein
LSSSNGRVNRADSALQFQLQNIPRETTRSVHITGEKMRRIPRQETMDEAVHHNLILIQRGKETRLLNHTSQESFRELTLGLFHNFYLRKLSSQSSCKFFCPQPEMVSTDNKNGFNVSG